jgi:hypothetical protein
MGTVVVRYQVTPDKAEENAGLIEKVFAELNADRPEGLRYASFLLEDGVTFLHIAITEGDADPLPQSPAFQAFQKDAQQRMDGGPVRSGSQVVGSYGFFDK